MANNAGPNPQLRMANSIPQLGNFVQQPGFPRFNMAPFASAPGAQPLLQLPPRQQIPFPNQAQSLASQQQLIALLQQQQGQRPPLNQVFLVNQQGQHFQMPIQHLISGIDPNMNNGFGAQIPPTTYSFVPHLPSQIQSVAQLQLLQAPNPVHQITQQQVDSAKISQFAGIPSITNQAALAMNLDPVAMNNLQHTNGTNPSIEPFLSANHSTVGLPNQLAMHPYQYASATGGAPLPIATSSAGGMLMAPVTNAMAQVASLNQFAVIPPQQPPHLTAQLTANALNQNGALTAALPMMAGVTNGTPAPNDSLVDSQREQMRATSGTPQTAAPPLSALIGASPSVIATANPDARGANATKLNVGAKEFVPYSTPKSKPSNGPSYRAPDGTPVFQSTFNPAVTFPLPAPVTGELQQQPPPTPPKSSLSKKESKAIEIVNPESHKIVPISELAATSKKPGPEESANSGVIVMTSDPHIHAQQRSRSSSIAIPVAQPLQPPTSESAPTPPTQSDVGERSRTTSLSQDLSILSVEEPPPSADSAPQALPVVATLAPSSIADPVAKSLSTTSVSSGIEPSASIFSSSPSLVPQLSETDTTRVSSPSSVVEPNGDRMDLPDRALDDVSVQSVESQLPDDEPTLSASGRKLYSRDFLLRFQSVESSCVRPDGLKSYEDYSKKTPVMTRSSTQSPNLTFGAGNDFLPGFLSQKMNFTPSRSSQTMMRPGGFNSMGKPRQAPAAPPMRVIELPNATSKLHRAEKAWTPRFKSSSSAAPDSETLETEVTSALVRQLRSILNKVTPEKFRVLIDKILELMKEVKSIERLNEIVNLIFEKAISEPNFAISYAYICKYLINFDINTSSGEQPVQTQSQSANASKPVSKTSFRYLLISRCQHEFERRTSTTAPGETGAAPAPPASNLTTGESLQRELESLRRQMDDAGDKEKQEKLQEDMAEISSKIKRRAIGNVKFIGELFKLEILNERIVYLCITNLLTQGGQSSEVSEDDNLECLCKLLFTIGLQLDKKESNKLDQVFREVERLVSEPSSRRSTRTRCLMKDVLELRDRSWRLRMVAEVTTGAPKTLEQIHREAAAEEQERSRYSQLMNTMPLYGSNYQPPMYGTPPAFAQTPSMAMPPYYDSPTGPPHYYDLRQNSGEY